MVSQLIKIFPALYGSQKFVTLFTTARHWSRFWATFAQSYTIKIHFNIVRPLTSSFSKWFFRSSFPQKPGKHFPSPYDLPVPSSWFWHKYDTARVHLLSSLLYVILSILHFFLSLLQNDRRHGAVCSKAAALSEFVDLWAGSSFRWTPCTISVAHSICCQLSHTYSLACYSSDKHPVQFLLYTPSV